MLLWETAPGLESLVGQKISCQAKDISMNGICLFSETQLPKEADLQIDLKFGSPPKTFSLSGNVIWSEHEKDHDLYRVGVHISKHPDDDVAWNNAVLQLLVH